MYRSVYKKFLISTLRLYTMRLLLHDQLIVHVGIFRDISVLYFSAGNHSSIHSNLTYQQPSQNNVTALKNTAILIKQDKTTGAYYVY